MALSKRQRFEVLRQVLAMAEERHHVGLRQAAAATGVAVDELRELLEPLLHLSFRSGLGERIDRANDFHLTDDGVLVVTRRHWLRDLQATPPSVEAALRLLVAAVAVQGMVDGPTRDLDRGIAKLRRVVGTMPRVPVPRPPGLSVAQQAWYEGRSLRFRYAGHDDESFSDHEVFPHLLFCSQGHWYLHGVAVDGSAARVHRVDRMHDTTLGTGSFEPPRTARIPDRVDPATPEHRLTVRLDAARLARYPVPYRLERCDELDDGRVEIELVVAGDRRLEHLLVCLTPDIEVVGPPEAVALQRAEAGRLLAAYRPAT